MIKTKEIKWANGHPAAAGFVVLMLYVLFRRSSYFLFKSVLPQTDAVAVIHELADVAHYVGYIYFNHPVSAQKKQMQ